MENITWDDFDSVVFDLDGTLLNHEKVVSAKTKEILTFLDRRGKKTFVATGRPWYFAKKEIKGINGTQIVSCNGAFVYDFKNKETLLLQPIETETAKQIFNFLLRHKATFVIYSQDGMYAFSTDPKNSNWINWLDSQNQSLLSEERFLLNVSNVEEEATFDFYRNAVLEFVVVLNETPYESVAKIWEYLRELHLVYPVQSQSHILDIMPQNVSKGSGLDELVERGLLDLKRTIVFGDQYNDVSMFEKAAFSVAMGNARDFVKSKATFTTLAHSNEGVYHFFNSVVLEPQELQKEQPQPTPQSQFTEEEKLEAVAEVAKLSQESQAMTDFYEDFIVKLDQVLEAQDAKTEQPSLPPTDKVGSFTYDAEEYLEEDETEATDSNLEKYVFEDEPEEEFAQENPDEEELEEDFEEEFDEEGSEDFQDKLVAELEEELEEEYDEDEDEDEEEDFDEEEFVEEEFDEDEWGDEDEEELEEEDDDDDQQQEFCGCGLEKNLEETPPTNRLFELHKKLAQDAGIPPLLLFNKKLDQLLELLAQEEYSQDELETLIGDLEELSTDLEFSLYSDHQDDLSLLLDKFEQVFDKLADQLPEELKQKWVQLLEMIEFSGKQETNQLIEEENFKNKVEQRLEYLQKLVIFQSQRLNLLEQKLTAFKAAKDFFVKYHSGYLVKEDFLKLEEALFGEPASQNPQENTDSNLEN